MSCLIKKDTNLCKIKNCIINISGMDSNSTSPSDTWFLNFDNTYYKNEYLNEITKIDKGFLKLFLSINDHLRKEKFKKALYGLRYEIDVYRNVINKFLNLKICTNFVNFLGATSSCTYNNLITLLSNNIIIESTKLPVSEIEKSLKNTIYNCFINSCKKRQTIERIVHTEEGEEDEEDEENEIKNFNPSSYNYSMILLESIPKNTISFTIWLNENYSKHTHEFWNILFQIVYACYIMSLSKMNHNDLHASNIFIQELDEKQVFLYYINEEKYYILTKFKVMLFDFDRSYVEFLGKNKMLNTSLCQKGQQCNKFVENKDVIKLFCYVFKRYFLNNKNEDVKEKLLNIISDCKKIQNDLMDVYKDCLLKYFFNNSIEPDIFHHCHNTFKILQHVYSNVNKVEFLDRVKKIKKIEMKNVSVCNSSFFLSDGQINITESIRYYKDIEKEIEQEIEKEIKTEIEKEKKEIEIEIEKEEEKKKKEKIIPDILLFDGYTTDEVLELLK